MQNVLHYLASSRRVDYAVRALLEGATYLGGTHHWLFLASGTKIFNITRALRAPSSQQQASLLSRLSQEARTVWVVLFHRHTDVR